MKKTAFASCIILLFIFSIPNCVLSAESSQTRKTKKIQAENSEAQVEAIEKRDKVINDLLKRVETLEQEVRTLRVAPPSGGTQPGEPSTARSASAKKADTAVEQKTPSPVQRTAPPPRDRKEKEEEEQLAQQALERVLIQRSAVLLPAGTLEIEPSLTYSHASSDRVIINGVAIIDFFGVGLAIGDIVSERVKRDLLIPTLTGRLGLPWDSQAEVRLPVRYESEGVVTGDFRERSRSAFGMGDMELALSRQLLREKAWWPDLVGSLRWRVPTQTTDDTFHGLQFQLSSVKVRDPVAFFGGIAYTANIPETQEGFYINPGDTMGFNMGLALSLNPETSINFQWDQRFTNGTSVDGQKIAGSNLVIGVFRVGFTYALSKNYFLDLGVGIGITTDAPDLQATIALPIRFPDMLFKSKP